MTVITVLLLVTTTQLNETGETVEENDHMWHGICCYVTRRRRARGVNQQRHVSKGASPAHSPEVARRGQCFKTMQLLSSLRDRNQPVFTSHTDDAGESKLIAKTLKSIQYTSLQQPLRQLPLQRLSYVPAHSEPIVLQKEKLSRRLSQLYLFWLDAESGGRRRWTQMAFSFFFKSQFPPGQFPPKRAKRCENSISNFINFRQTPDSRWRACLPALRVHAKWREKRRHRRPSDGVDSQWRAVAVAGSQSEEAMLVETRPLLLNLCWQCAELKKRLR